MIYLVTMEAFDPNSGAVVTERFSIGGYTTRPSDDLSSIHFKDGITDPGNYRRAVFERGRTSGVSSIGAGLIKIANPDGSFDRLSRYAVDGRRLTIHGLRDLKAAWSARKLIFTGTMEQIEFAWREVRIRLRDRAAELAEPLQPALYAGTTTAGGINEAEGEDDLKGKAKPIAWGRVFNVSPVLANRFHLIWQVSSRPLSAVDAVRDAGVALTFDRNFATLADLRTATIPTGRYATCLALGLVRTQREPVGDLTVDTREGADGQRSAALTARRVLEFAGFVEGRDFLAADFAALHTLNPAEVGWWTGTERVDIGVVVSTLLDSIGAAFVPDSLGRFRAFRINAPVASSGARTFAKQHLIDSGDGIDRLATTDEGNGVPAAQVTIRYARNWTVQTKAVLDATASTQAVRAFALEEYRNAVAEDAGVRNRHLLATEMTFDTALCFLADAQAEATRRMGIYGVRRDRYRITLKAEFAVGVELGDVVVLRLDRFDLAAGKPFVVIGEEVSLVSGKIVLDLYG